MNKSVFISMVVLVVCFLLGMYVLKIFFPEQFLFVIDNETIVEIGNYIDSHTWAYYAVGIITSFITYYLFICAVCGKRMLSAREILIVLVVIGASIGVSFFDEKATAIIGYISLVGLPVLFGCRNAKPLAIVFCVHLLAQYLSLSIRSLPLYVAYYNSLSYILLTLEMYLWLILFYIIYNYKNKENKNGLASTSAVRKQKEQILRKEDSESTESN